MNTRVGTSIVKKLYDEIDKKSKSNGKHRKITPIDKIIASIIIASIVILAAGAISYYNKFVYLTSDVETNLAQIDVQIQKRKNLIINLEKTVIDYSKHEREIFTLLAELRRGMPGKIPDEILKSVQKNIPDVQSSTGNSKNNTNWNENLSKLMAIAEMYPDLKLNENFITFMNAIIEFENKIAESRMKYNDSLNELTNAVEEFPGNFYFTIFKFRFKSYKYFKLNEDENNFIKINY